MMNMKFYANTDNETNVKELKSNDMLWQSVCSYMDDEIREATCDRMFHECAEEEDTCEMFLIKYLESDDAEFLEILENEFGFEYED